jgi:hypothetical protein
VPRRSRVIEAQDVLAHTPNLSYLGCRTEVQIPRARHECKCRQSEVTIVDFQQPHFEQSDSVAFTSPCQSSLDNCSGEYANGWMESTRYRFLAVFFRAKSWSSPWAVRKRWYASWPTVGARPRITKVAKTNALLMAYWSTRGGLDRKLELDSFFLN